MIDSTLVLAQTGAEAAPGPAGVVVVGFLFVVVVLALLAAVTSAMGAWFTKQAANDAAKAAKAAKAAAEASANTSEPAGNVSAATAPPTGSGSDGTELGEDPALTAVIAAAVHTVFRDRPHRVVSVRSAGPGWAQEGRRQIFSSHRVR